MKKNITNAIALIPNSARVFVHGASATPLFLLNELIKQAPRFKNLELMHLHTCGDAEYAKAQYKDNFKVTNFFVGGNMRKLINYENVDYLPCFLSEIPQLMRSGLRTPDVALLHLSPPDIHGHCTIGTSVDVTRAAIDSAKIIIAQINIQMPRLHGDSTIHISELDAYVEIDEALPEVILADLTKDEEQIGKNVAGLVEDGATLQMGIGSIPNAVLKYLHNHKNLGLHTEMWSDGALPLIEKNIINNKLKKIHPHRSVSTFLMGSKKLYDFVNDNPTVIQLDASYVNNPTIIARNKKVTAINSAVEVDLTGQVCADSIGPKIISGVGGQIDFVRGASLSEGGKPIIAMSSRTNKGVSRLVTTLKAGAGVVTTRAHIHYVVTEFGVAQLYGKTLGERAKGLIEISHPDDREKLHKEWWQWVHQ
jgi:acyl-CoA hydrolase